MPNNFVAILNLLVPEKKRLAFYRSTQHNVKKTVQKMLPASLV